MNQLIKTSAIATLLLVIGLNMSAQKLEMIEFEETTELSAAQYKVYDSNDNVCALIKLGLIAKKPWFEGNIVKSEDKGGVYWLYVPRGTTGFTINSENYLPLTVNFEPVNSLFTYRMTVGPQQNVDTRYTRNTQNKNNSRLSIKPSIKSDYNYVTLSYNNWTISDLNSDGIGIEYIHGFSLSSKSPIFLETGIKAMYSLFSFEEEGYGFYDSFDFSTLKVSVPLRLTYKFGGENISYAPFTGVSLGYIFANDYADGDFGASWQIGLGLDIKKFHIQVGYDLDVYHSDWETDGMGGNFNIGIGIKF
ncbi:MAG: hypothetical protein NC127_06295 [Muribaculum sp.]|nr:hypothetical protein [Muribaculum sp.]